MLLLVAHAASGCASVYEYLHEHLSLGAVLLPEQYNKLRPVSSSTALFTSALTYAVQQPSCGGHVGRQNSG